jgi:NAD(P)-dependent dehydrogenase (short-subunit alcohol dehydrogenase family)
MGAIVVTGGAGGLGTAIRARLRAIGQPIVSIDIRPSDTDESHVIDVSSEDEMARLLGTVAKRHGSISALVCAAGLVEEAPVIDMSLESWHRVVDASLTGAFIAAKHVLPSMVAAGSGALVGFSSGYGSMGYRKGANYAAAKAGIEALFKSIALEHALDGIRANVIAPGPIMTAMLTESRIPVITPMIPMKRVGVPDDIVGVVHFLVSDDSAYITGQVIHVNGGLLMP